MASLHLLAVVYYGYPLALYLVLATSLLTCRFYERTVLTKVYPIQRPCRFMVIYVLQCLFTLLALCSLGIGIAQFITTLRTRQLLELAEAPVVSYNTLFVKM